MNHLSSAKESYRVLIIIVFIFASLLRFSLALVNDESNDDHVEVIKVIRDEGRLPIKEDCRECFHAKFYHASVAGLLKIFSITDEMLVVKIAQVVNALAGILTLWIVYLFLKERGLNPKVELISFAFIALNPKLIGINAQATNDSFAILFSTAALYNLDKYFTYNRVVLFWWAVVYAVLAAITKATTLTLSAGIFLILFIKCFVTPAIEIKIRRQLFILIIGFSVIWLSIVPAIGQYWTNYQRYGSPITIDLTATALPDLWKEKIYYRPGVTSFTNTYLTFRFIDLFKHPTIQTNSADNYPAHRTSFWTQLYGRMHFVHFDFWPPSWQTTDPFVLNVGRLIFLLALWPTLLLLKGMGAELSLLIRAIKNKRFNYFKDTNSWGHFMIIALSLLSVIIFSMKYKDFSSMKVIYVFPAILAFLDFFIKGCESAYSKKQLAKICDGTFVALFVLYFIDISSLIMQLFNATPRL